MRERVLHIKIGYSWDGFTGV